MYSSFLNLVFPNCYNINEMLRLWHYNLNLKAYYYSYFTTKKCFYLAFSNNSQDWGGDFIYRYNKNTKKIDLFKVINNGSFLYKLKYDDDQLPNFVNLIYDSEYNQLIKDFNMFIKNERFSLLYGDIYYNYQLIDNKYKITYSYCEKDYKKCIK